MECKCRSDSILQLLHQFHKIPNRIRAVKSGIILVKHHIVAVLCARHICPFTTELQFDTAVAVVTVIALGFDEDDFTVVCSDDEIRVVVDKTIENKAGFVAVDDAVPPADIGQTGDFTDNAMLKIVDVGFLLVERLIL